MVRGEVEGCDVDAVCAGQGRVRREGEVLRRGSGGDAGGRGCRGGGGGGTAEKSARSEAVRRKGGKED
jgi:hypothetical protein